MLKNYNDKFKQNLDDALRYRTASSDKQAETKNKLEILKRFACTLDIKNESEEAPEKK